MFCLFSMAAFGNYPLEIEFSSSLDDMSQADGSFF